MQVRSEEQVQQLQLPVGTAQEQLDQQTDQVQGRHERAVHEEEPEEPFQELDQQKPRNQEPGPQAAMGATTLVGSKTYFHTHAQSLTHTFTQEATGDTNTHTHTHTHTHTQAHTHTHTRIYIYTSHTSPTSAAAGA
jgi:hypothetical protein